MSTKSTVPTARPDFTASAPFGAVASIEMGEHVGEEAYPGYLARMRREWLAALEERWAEAVELVSVETARVWRLYLAGGALAFEQGRMGVDQVLARRR